MALTLPTTPTQAEGGAPRILTIYGPPKVGKTTLLSALPNNLLIDLEQGSDYVTALKIKPDNMLQLKALIGQINTAKQPYQFVSIDTLDKLEEWSEVEATRQYKNSIMGKSFGGDSVLELPKGAGYYYLRAVFKEYFTLLCTSAKYVIFVGHIKDKFLTVDSKDVLSTDLDLTGKIRNIVCSLSDAIGHVYRDKDGKLSMSFRTTESMQCGARCEHLRGKVLTFSNPPTVSEWKQIYTQL